MPNFTERLLACRDRDFEYDLNGRLRAESYITPGSDDRIRCYTYDVLGSLHRGENCTGPAASGVTGEPVVQRPSPVRTPCRRNAARLERKCL